MTVIKNLVLAMMLMPLTAAAQSTSAQTTAQNSPAKTETACGSLVERTLFVNGRRGPATMIEINGQTFVNLQQMAEIANGNLSFPGGDRIALVVPGTLAPARAPAARQTQEAPASNASALSRPLMHSGIEALAIMREWRSTLVFAVQNSYPANGKWVNDYHDRAVEAVRLASVSATTPADHSALALLHDQFENIQSWSNSVVAQRQGMNGELAVTPETINGDAVYQKIVNCGHFLSNMLLSGELQDDASCH